MESGGGGGFRGEITHKRLDVAFPTPPLSREGFASRCLGVGHGYEGAALAPAGPLLGASLGLGLTLGVGLGWGELTRICLFRRCVRGVGALWPRSCAFIACLGWGGEARAAAGGAGVDGLSGQVDGFGAVVAFM